MDQGYRRAFFGSLKPPVQSLGLGFRACEIEFKLCSQLAPLSGG
jgi:hypothetical protein